jgi:hypothetical protein
MKSKNAYIPREQYLAQLISFKDSDIIKVITGIRRCGKSTLLFEIYYDWLKGQGIADEQIIKVDLELQSNSHLLDGAKLYEYIKSKIVEGKQSYIMIDEVQNCIGFQKVVASLHKEKFDVYITGSNAYVFSGELATYLAGRYVEIEILPLSFKEFSSATKKSDEHLNDVYKRYVTYGAFPRVISFGDDSKMIDTYIEGIYNSIFVKDIILRNKITAIPMFEMVMKFVLSNIGSPISASSISKYLESTGRKVHSQTVDDFLGYLVQGYIVYKADRYDVKGKEILRTLGKYYATDIGLRNFLLGYREMDSGHVLENIVYFELLRRSYKVFVGKVDNKEVDFIAKKKDEILYIQVADSVRAKETLERELAPFKMIKDFYQRILITMDNDPNVDYDGIRHINALNFLMQGEII